MSFWVLPRYMASPGDCECVGWFFIAKISQCLSDHWSCPDTWFVLMIIEKSLKGAELYKRLLNIEKIMNMTDMSNINVSQGSQAERQELQQSLTESITVLHN